MMEFRDLSKQLWVSFLLAAISFANSADAEVERECKAVLSGLSWVFEEGRHDYPLGTEDTGLVLDGLACSEKEIIAWFEDNGWTFLRSNSIDGGWFGYGSKRYRMDRGLVFCQPQPFYLGWLSGGCRGQTAVSLFEGRITQITSGPTK